MGLSCTLFGNAIDQCHLKLSLKSFFHPQEVKQWPILNLFKVDDIVICWYFICWCSIFLTVWYVLHCVTWLLFLIFCFDVNVSAVVFMKWRFIKGLCMYMYVLWNVLLLLPSVIQNSNIYKSMQLPLEQVAVKCFDPVDPPSLGALL